jgi:nucleoside-diphosphate-sugar epimerase
MTHSAAEAAWKEPRVKVLVTGGTGFTGSHTARALVDAGHEVRLLVRDADKARSVFEPHGFVPSDLVVGDMTDQDAVDGALVGCEAVIHTAAVVDLRRAMARFVEETNAHGVELVVGGAARRGIPNIVYVSSLAVFFVPGGPPLSVDLPIAAGTTAYARSKARGEVCVRRLREGRGADPHFLPCLDPRARRPGMSAGNNGVYSFFKDVGLITSSGVQCVDVRDLATLHQALADAAWGASLRGHG